MSIVHDSSTDISRIPFHKNLNKICSLLHYFMTKNLTIKDFDSTKVSSKEHLWISFVVISYGNALLWPLTVQSNSDDHQWPAGGCNHFCSISMQKSMNSSMSLTPHCPTPSTSFLPLTLFSDHSPGHWETNICSSCICAGVCVFWTCYKMSTKIFVLLTKWGHFQEVRTFNLVLTTKGYLSFNLWFKDWD